MRGVPGGERALDLTCAKSCQNSAYQTEMQGADNAGVLSGDAFERTGVQSDTRIGSRGFEFRIEPHLREQGSDDDRRIFCGSTVSGGFAEIIQRPLPTRSLGELFRITVRVAREVRRQNVGQLFVSGGDPDS